MFRLMKSNTLRRSVHQSTSSIRTYTSLKNADTFKAQAFLSNTARRTMSSNAAGKSNELMLIGASAGILSGALGLLYYFAAPALPVFTPAPPLPVVIPGPVATPVQPVEEPLVSEDAVPEDAVPEDAVPEDAVPDVVVENVQDTVEESVEVVEETVSSSEAIIPVIALPESSTYVIVGAGTAAHAACRAICKNQPDAKVLVIGNEAVLPYMRPPLSKEMWFGNDPKAAANLVFKSWNGKERSVFFEDKSYYTPVEQFNDKEDGAVTVLTGKTVTAIDAESHKLQLDSGETIGYGKLLIATGGQPRNHPVFAKAGKAVGKHITLFRNVANFQSLDNLLKDKGHVTIVGGGFLGSELACALAARGKTSGLNVTQVYAEDGNMAKVLPRYLSAWTTRKVSKEGVDIVSNRSIMDAKVNGKKVELELDNGEKLATDHVVVCVGLEPHVELANSAGLEVDPVQGGFRVNSELEARSDIWVAGDAACFYDINLGRRRVEHHDHAVVSGRLAGENMTGAKKAYKHQSMFWSDLGPEVGYEAIGLVDSSLPTIGVWSKATAQDTPKGAEQATGESIPSERPEEQVTKQTKVLVETSETTEKKAEDDSEAFGKGVVFYMKEKKIVGILLWNIFSQMPIARRLVSEGKDYEDLSEVAKLFSIHSP